MKKTTEKSKLRNRLATLPYAVARNSASAACILLVYQPKEPLDMEARLRAMKKREEC